MTSQNPNMSHPGEYTTGLTNEPLLPVSVHEAWAQSERNNDQATRGVERTQARTHSTGEQNRRSESGRLDQEGSQKESRSVARRCRRSRCDEGGNQKLYSRQVISS